MIAYELSHMNVGTIETIGILIAIGNTISSIIIAEMDWNRNREKRAYHSSCLQCVVKFDIIEYKWMTCSLI